MDSAAAKPRLDQKPAPALACSSLGRRLVLATLIFCLLFTLLAVTLRSVSAWNSNLAAMTAELKLIDQVFQRTLSKAIWEMDRDALQTQLDSVAQAAPVGRVQLSILRAGRPPEVLTQQRAERQPSTLVPSLQQTLTYEPYPGATQNLGELVIEGDERLLWQRLLSDVTSIVITQVIQSLLLAGLIMWMFNRSVTVHVRHIAQHLGELSPANLKRLLRIERKASRRDELSLLEAGVNNLQGKLSDYLQQQRRDELDLAAHRDRLAELVEERTAELRQANSRLEELSRSDPLTGLANRRHFDEMKEIELRRATRLNQPLSVLMCDIDCFKLYNDTYGHAQGDQCLQRLAERLKHVFGRAGELVARLGGEEFAVLLPGADLDQAHKAAERLRQDLAAQAVPHSSSQVEPYLTLSIGVAQYDPQLMDRFDQLLQCADEALYRAKRLGRDRIAQ
ncbi:GGDEF domain-containing protein [Pseudomonas benzenivorans]|uniref:diguanylate cyclase n=1 Tax=Pseudomonas benzenivorans TaxID=556533 RepID=A0ABY5H6F6_9PSED|nr:diguanylate cyclase [Pseudomonas benzenivorans]UTW06636.1 diguanylate cyclase [Pseudomonas benzenivorans]